MTYKIGLAELLKENIIIHNQMILEILRQKGAPIKGNFWLEQDFYNFDWFLSYDKITKEIIAEVIEK